MMMPLQMTSQTRPEGVVGRGVRGCTLRTGDDRERSMAKSVGAASARWLQVREKLLVCLHHLFDEPKLEALLPRERRLELFLLEENLDVLVPGRHRLRRDARVEHHLRKRLPGNRHVQPWYPAGRDLCCLVGILARLPSGLGHTDDVLLDQLRLLLDDVV